MLSDELSEAIPKDPVGFLAAEAKRIRDEVRSFHGRLGKAKGLVPGPKLGTIVGLVAKAQVALDAAADELSESAAS